MSDHDRQRRFDVRIGNGVKFAAIVFVVAVIVAAADRALIAPEAVSPRGGFTQPAAERPTGDPADGNAPGAQHAVSPTERVSRSK
jgi:hypothetical protein